MVCLWVQVHSGQELQHEIDDAVLMNNLGSQKSVFCALNFASEVKFMLIHNPCFWHFWMGTFLFHLELCWAIYFLVAFLSMDWYFDDCFNCLSTHLCERHWWVQEATMAYEVPQRLRYVWSAWRILLRETRFSLHISTWRNFLLYLKRQVFLHLLLKSGRDLMCRIELESTLHPALCFWNNV
jgi:hypothetical protein